MDQDGRLPRFKKSISGGPTQTNLTDQMTADHKSLIALGATLTEG
jgi:hypothetical protein